MAYSDISLLAGDSDFSSRVAACAATETLASEVAFGDPYAWARDHSWELASQPGFGDAYASALANGVERPGWDPSVISDGQILSAVQPMLPQPEPPVINPEDAASEAEDRPEAE